MQPNLTTPSIVDYLSSVGKPSDFATRTNLATQNGIGNYTGTAQQNSQLLSLLRGSGTTNSTAGGGVNDQYLNDNNFITSTNSVTQKPGESNADFKVRVANQPFYLAGGPDPSGKTQYLTPDQIQQSYLNNLVQNTAPTAQLKTPNVSPGTPGVGGIDGMLAYYKSLFDTSTQQAKDLKDQEDAARTKQATDTQPFLSKLLTLPTPDTTRTTATAQTGIDPTTYFAQEKAQIADIQATTNQYNQAVAARDTQIAQTNDKLASLNFINNQTAQINRNAAPVLNQLSATINAKAAALQASQGMWTEAQNFIHQAVDAATADLKYNFDMYNEFYTQNQDIIKGLDTKYQSAIADARTDAEKAFTIGQDQATKVGQLILDNPQAGITMADTLNQAIEKVQRTPKTTGATVGSENAGYTNVVRDSQGNVVKTQPIIGGAVPAGGVKLTPTQINSASSSLGITTDDYKKLDPQIQTFFTTSYGNAFVKALGDIGKTVNGSVTTRQDILDSINASPQPQQVKDYMTQILDKRSPASTNDKGFFSKLGNWFSGNGFQ